MEDIQIGHITVDRINWPVFSEKNIGVDILRLDKIHPVVSGNKWFKLRYYLDEAIRLRKTTIATFGGAWSNHIAATAAIARLHEFNSIGIIRGEEPLQYSSTLDAARNSGMNLFFVSREAYRQKKIPFDLSSETYLVNEGGFGELGMKGAATILDHCEKNDYSHICCATGTGTMTAGIMAAAPVHARVLPVNIMKPNPTIRKNIEQLVGKPLIDTDFVEGYHFGGYARYNAKLIQFMNHFYQQTGIPTDFVYTGKLCFAIADLAEKNYFPPGSRLLLIHSGGLQGNLSMDNGTLIF